MAVVMNTLDFARRDLLKLSSTGLAASAAVALPAFAAAQSTGAAGSATPTFFDVRAFGATGDGKTVDSPAINKAIEAAAAAGGGTVVFPSGHLFSFSIRLKSHVTSISTQGAAILAADSPQARRNHRLHRAAPTTPPSPRPLGRLPGLRPQPLAQLADLGRRHHDFSITGPGLIYGKGLSFGAGPGRGQHPDCAASAWNGPPAHLRNQPAPHRQPARA